MNEIDMYLKSKYYNESYGYDRDPNNNNTLDTDLNSNGKEDLDPNCSNDIEIE